MGRCTEQSHFQIIPVDLTKYKAGYPGQEKGMQYQSGYDKTVIRLDTCTGETSYLEQLDDKTEGKMTTHWIPIANF